MSGLDIAWSDPPIPGTRGGRLSTYRLVGQVVKASTPKSEGPEFESRLIPEFSKIDTPVATLPGAWRYRVSAGTDRPGVSIQWLPCQAPGVIGSALGLVGLVSVYCDWVR